MKNPETTHAETRREEIIAACEKLYETMNFKDITIKEIAAYTSFSRPSIYNYFETKEEIFLAIFEKEYRAWNADLADLRDTHDALSADEFAHCLAATLDRRPLLLRLLSMNMYDMEENSRMERLTEFKAEYGKSFGEVRLCLEKFFPDMGEERRAMFVRLFFPFMFGLYPYAVITPKQREAIAKAGAPLEETTVAELAEKFVREILR